MSPEQSINAPDEKRNVGRTVLRRTITKDLAFENLCDFVEATSGYALHPWQKILCERLQKLADQKGQRLLIHAAPQVGKSQIVSKRFPAWMVWRRKTLRVILAAYNKSHAGGLIDAAKNAAMHEVVGKEIQWNKSNADDGIFSAERLALNDAQPSLIGVGLESGYTGKNADCFVAGTKVATPGGVVNIEDIRLGMTVRSYNFESERIESRRVIATRIEESETLVRAVFKSGQTFTCTADHLVFVVGRGYVKAGDLAEWDEVRPLEANREMLSLRQESGLGVRDLSSLQVGIDSDNKVLRVPCMWNSRQPPSIRSQQSKKAGNGRSCLFPQVHGRIPCSIYWGKVRTMRESDAPGTRSTFLFDCLSATSKAFRRKVLGVRDKIQEEIQPDCLLQPRLCEHGSCQTHEGCRQLKIQNWKELCQMVSRNATFDCRKGWKRLRTLRSGRWPDEYGAQDQSNQKYSRYSPHRSQSGQQYAGEPYSSLQALPQSLSQHNEFRDYVDSVQKLCGRKERVYDIQVEGTSNFFAENVLVHNCLIIDDPYPNAEAARSEAYNRSVRSFWEETAEPRLLANPDANVVVMFHRYHENDIAGYLMSRFQNWEVMRFAAIADGGTDDPTGRKIGELLSPFHTLEHLQAKERDDPKTFAGQFQGKPLADGEQLFEPWMFEDRFVDPLEVPPISPWYRGVDTAFTTETYSDKTGTARLAFDPDGNLWIRGTETQKLRPGNMVDWLEGIAERESRATTWVIEQHNAGYAAHDRLQRLGFPVWSQKIQGAQGSKLQRAFILHDLAYRRKVFIVKEGAWQDLSAQLFAFTGDPKLKEKDDLIDAISVVLVRLKETRSENQLSTPPNRFLAGIQYLADDNSGI